jgi:WhiB family redox-sensing transcriptional regulator
VSWADHAACRGQPVARFFPLPGDTSTRDEAFAVCARCPVTRACEEFADETGAADGVWAGRLREQERLKRSQRKKEVA